MNFFEVQCASFSYGSTEVLKNISFSIEKGKFVAIIGANGCGKSTLLKLLSGMATPTSGSVFVNGLSTSSEENLLTVRQNVGLVLQNPENQVVASIVEEDVAFGPENLGLSREEILKRIDFALKALDLENFRCSAVSSLSGGQKQRLAIAGILTMRPQCILLDESTAMLDPIGRREIIRLVRRLNREFSVTVVQVTHHMQEAALADEVMLLDSGCFLKMDTPREIFSQAKLLKAHGLCLPQELELLERLKEAGIPVARGVLGVKECTDALEAVWGLKCR